MGEFAKDFLLPFGFTLLFTIMLGSIICAVIKMIEFFTKKPKVIRYGTAWVIYRSHLGGQYYEVRGDYWWTTFGYADKFPTKEAALANLPPKSPGPIDKIRRKIQYKKIKKE